MSDTSTSPEIADVQEVGAAIRQAAGIVVGEGPSDASIEDAVDGFAEAFTYWYTRVLAAAVPKYRLLIVRRTNVLIRPIEFEGLPCSAVSTRLVSDYVNRNFVTAGGRGIERMAIALAGATGGAKASSRGIDLERTTQDGNRHLYVIKSGTVTRKSDILSKLKQHAREAEKLIRQGGAKIGVFANYAVATGATSSSFEDGIHRPSSGEFWAEITGLPEEKALALIARIAEAGGRQIIRDTDTHIGALITLVQSYIEKPDNKNELDWDFIFKATMTQADSWAASDQARNKYALSILKTTGYEIVKKARAETKGAPNKGSKKKLKPRSSKGESVRKGVAGR